jgi:hypothetical protein
MAAAFADADSMLAAGAFYRWDNTSTEGNLSMMFSRDFAVQGGLRGGFGPFWRLHAWALERAAAIHCQSGDPRWAIVGLGLGALAALDVFVQKQLAAWARKIITRALQGAYFAAAADTTVAAGGGQGRALFRAIGSLA